MRTLRHAAAALAVLALAAAACWLALALITGAALWPFLVFARFLTGGTP